MPDENGKLSQEERDAANKWIRERVKSPCAACGHAYWAVGSYVVSLSADTKNFLGTKKHYPALVTVCAECGHFRLHSAVLAGIIERDKDKQEKKEAKNAT